MLGRSQSNSTKALPIVNNKKFCLKILSECKNFYE